MKSETATQTQIGGTIFHWGRGAYVMGILNVTPDSFSGDGVGHDVDQAVQQALAMEAAGADIIDVGGESTRPAGKLYGEGATYVPADEELQRVLPVIRVLSQRLTIPISIDTYKAEVARQAIEAGAALINDVWAAQRDPAIARVAAAAAVPIVLNHNQQGYAYDDVMSDVVSALRACIEQVRQAGVPDANIIVDPGIGFGKNRQHNLTLLRRLDEFKAAFNHPLLVGTSRKGFIGEVLGGVPPQDRVEGTAATVAVAIVKGADIVRVHDVPEMVRVARMTNAIVYG